MKNLFELINFIDGVIDTSTRIAIQAKMAIDHNYSQGKTEYTGASYEKWKTKSGHIHIKDMSDDYIKNSILYITDVDGSVSNLGGKYEANEWLDAFENELEVRNVKFKKAKRK